MGIDKQGDVIFDCGAWFAVLLRRCPATLCVGLYLLLPFVAWCVSKLLHFDYCSSFELSYVATCSSS